MAEKCSKSKLKRKKSSVEDLQSDLCSLGAPKRSSSVTLLAGDGATNTDRSSLHAAAAWWNTLQPPAVESLWAFTLMSALPHLQNQHRDPVPDLPLPPAVVSYHTLFLWRIHLQRQLTSKHFNMQPSQCSKSKCTS
ncbi:hypothetical protein AMECASPLE_026773 [Ameca splendens]|uniref:Uncharacterized protein n=1 Tax=Ameca splendens TaxID=208324 RepID=A0ABV0Z4Y5_9TELE